MKRCIYLLLATVGIVFTSNSSVPHITLPAAQYVAQYYPEYVKPDNNDEIRPSYISFFKQQKPSWITTLWRMFFKSTHDQWLESFDIPAVKELVKEVLKQRTLREDYVVRLAHKPGDKLIMFGDIQGCLPSLVRSLSELHQQGILSDDLVLKEGYKIIFNSNVLGRTPYSLQTLAIVLTLMYKNPDRVLYIRGRHEEVDYWVKVPVSEQLYVWDERNEKDPNSMISVLAQFFRSLPLAIYIAYDQGRDLIRISGYGRDFAAIDEHQFDSFLNKEQQEQLAYYTITNTTKTSHEVHVRVLIKSFDSLEDFLKNDGLVLVDYLGGAIIWSIFSTSNTLYQRYADAHFDAFTVVELQEKLSQATITLYNRDIRTKNQFEATKQYALTSGEAMKVGDKVREEEVVVVGSSCDLTKSSAVRGIGLKLGLMLSCNEYNKQSGPQNKKIKIIMRDHKSETLPSLQNVEYFHNIEKTDLTIMSNGSAALHASLDTIITNSMLMLFPSNGASRYRNASVRGIIHLRASYRDQVYAMIPYLVEKLFIRRFAFLYQNDEYGLDVLQVAREILPVYGITEWAEIPYTRNVTDFQWAVEKIEEAQPEAIGLFSTSSPTEEFIRQFGVHAVVDMKLFGVDPLVDGLFDQFSKDVGLHCMLARIVPPPDTSDLPIVQEYRKAMDTAGLVYSDPSLEGYIGGSLLAHALEKIKGPITPESLESFFEQMKNYNFKGLEFNFKPETRELCSEVWLDTGDDKVIRIIDPEKEFKERFKQKMASPVGTVS